MLRAIALLFIVIVGGFAMAKDGGVKAPKGAAPIDQDEQFWNSEEGQDIQRLFEEFRAGKKTYDQTYDEYNAKWANKPLPSAPSQSPSAPYTPIR